MNKRAFTLIEVLAVIVIIGILSLIAVTSYNQYMNHTRDAAYSAAEVSMRESLEGMFIACMTDSASKDACNVFQVPSLGQTVKISLQELNDFAHLPRVSDPAQQGAFCDSNESYVIATGTNEGSNSNNINIQYQSCLSCSNYKTKGCSFE